MSREKQIEEMAKIVAVARGYGCTEQDHCDMSCQVCKVGCIPPEDAEILYNAGYRKQSEGEWVKFRLSADDTANRWKCSVCKSEKHEETDYCPECGAKMKGGGD